MNLLKTLGTVLDVADNVNNTYAISKNTEDGLSKYASKVDEISGSERTVSLARAALNGDWFDVVKLSFDQIVSIVSKDPLSFEDYIDAVSQYADGKAIVFSKEENLRFVGGDCTITVVEELRNVRNDVNLYFKNPSDAWIKKSFGGNTGFVSFTKEALEGAITDIMNEGGRKFPIVPPKE